MKRLFEEMSLDKMNQDDLAKPKLARQISISYMHNGVSTNVDPMAVKNKKLRAEYSRSFKEMYGYTYGDPDKATPVESKSNIEEGMTSLKLGS
ncbi:MAG: hypothetical protein P1U74_07140 [Legionellaceae bacterium]|nr:hypothetical protein [Legionellaceae bacterium]